MAADSPLDRVPPRTRGEARRAALRARGVTLAALARDLGCHLSVVSRVNAAKKRSASVERAIADALGLRLTQAFPEWYGPRRAALRPGRESGPRSSRSAPRSAPD
jgi:lambda repressor-like predicted transcriptional regulator